MRMAFRGMLATLAAAMALPLTAGGALALAPSNAPAPLSLRDAIALALGQNHDISIGRDSFQTSESALRRTRGAYDPSLRFELRLRDHTDAINSILNGAPKGEVAPENTDLLSSTSLTRLYHNGATSTVSLGISRNWTDSFLTLLSPSYTSLAGVELRQPLAQDRRIDPARAAIRIARADRSGSTAEFRQRVAETVAAVEREYWSVVGARRDRLAREESLELARGQLADTEARVQAGVLGESELAQPVAEVERRRGELLLACQVEARAQNRLKLLVLADPADARWGEDVVPADVPGAPGTSGAPFALPDLARAMADASAYRPEVAQAEARVERQRTQLELARNGLRPRVDLLAGVTARGLSGSLNPSTPGFLPFPPVDSAPLVGGLGHSFQTLTDARYPDASIGVAVSRPIGNHAAREDLAAANHALHQAQTALEEVRQRIGAEVRDAIVGVQTAAARIQAARAGRHAATTQLDAERDRFQAGASSNFLVLTRQNDLAQARIAETAALVDYGKARTELARATGTLLEQRDITITGESAALSVPARTP